MKAPILRLCILLGMSMAAQAQDRALWAKDVVDNIGVNTHIPYQWSGYWDADKTAADLKFLGIKNIRDLQVGTLTTEQSRFGKVADAGNKIDYIFKYTIPDGVARIEAFALAHPGSVLAVEGPNEISNQPITYNGLSGPAAGAAYQAALYDAVKASAIIGTTPVYSLSDSPAYPAKLDAASSHPYARNGAQPFATLQKAYTSWSSYYPGKKVIFTETGYHTQLGRAGGVNAATQAPLTLNAVLDSFWLGVSKVFLYELLDEGSSAKVGGEWHYGLFNYDHTPKPAAIALANFIALLRDTGSSSSIPAFSYSVTNLPSTAKVMRFAKSDGSQILALWNEPPIWNSATETPIPVAASSVAISFGSNAGAISVYDPVSGTTALTTLPAGSRSATISLADHPILIVISPN